METTEEFIKEAIKIHGSKYEYQKACYLKSNIKIIITCKEHGDFEQSTKKHLQGQGCKQCGYIKNGNLTRLTTEQFIEKANLIHNNYYSYEFTNYISNKEKVIITCPIHGDFSQTASSHLQGVNCKSCSHIKSGESGRKGIEEILKKFNKKHKDFYVYNLNEDIKTARENLSNQGIDISKMNDREVAEYLDKDYTLRSKTQDVLYLTTYQGAKALSNMYNENPLGKLSGGFRTAESYIIGIFGKIFSANPDYLFLNFFFNKTSIIIFIF